MDIGRVIKAEIIDAGDFDVKERKKQAKKPIPFPCLITQLCRTAGVPEYADDDILDDSWAPVSLRSWTDSVSKSRRAKRPRTTGPSGRDFGPEESDEEDYDFEETGDDGNEDSPEGNNQIMDQLNWLVDAFRTS